MKKNNLSTNTILLAIGTFLNKGLQFLMIPLFSRWLSTEDYGSFDLFTTYVALMIPIVTLACSEAVFRYGIEQDENGKKSDYITNGFAIVACNSVILMAFLILLYVFTKWNYVFLFFLMALGEIINNYLQGYLRSIRKLNIYSFCSAFSTLCIALCVTIFVLVFNMGLKGMVLGYAIGYLIGDFAIIITTNYKQYFDFKKINTEKIKELISYSFALIPNNISWWIINVSDRTIINVFLGAASNGIYAIACKIPNFCSAFFGVFSISWQETASDMVGSGKRNEYYNSIFNQMVVVLISLCSGIVCCNFIFFNVIFDNRYTTGQLYTPILLTSALLGSLSQFFGGIQISLKKTKANGLSTMAGAVVNLAVHFSLISFLDLYAAAVSTLLSNIVIVVLRVLFLRNDVCLRFENKNYIYILIYIYFIISSYCGFSIILRFFNLLTSGVLFIYVNQRIIKEYTTKLLRYL